MADPSDAELLMKISAAFPDAPPSHFPVVVCDCDECAQVDADFRGKRWSEIELDMLKEHFSALPLLSPEAFRYYLPAFMRGAIADPESILPEFTMYSLLPSDLKRHEMCGFSDDQRGVVVEFARWAAWSPESEQIEAYWLKMEKS